MEEGTPKLPQKGSRITLPWRGPRYGTKYCGITIERLSPTASAKLRCYHTKNIVEAKAEKGSSNLDNCRILLQTKKTCRYINRRHLSANPVNKLMDSTACQRRAPGNERHRRTYFSPGRAVIVTVVAIFTVGLLPAASSRLSKPPLTSDRIDLRPVSLGRCGNLDLYYQILREPDSGHVVDRVHYAVRFTSVNSAKVVNERTVNLGFSNSRPPSIQQCDIMHYGYDQLLVNMRGRVRTAELFNWNGTHYYEIYRSKGAAYTACVRTDANRWAVCECWNVAQNFRCIKSGTYYLDPEGELAWRYLVPAINGLRPCSPDGNTIECTTLSINWHHNLLTVGGPQNRVRVFSLGSLAQINSFRIPCYGRDYGICGLQFAPRGVAIAGGGLGLATVLYTGGSKNALRVIAEPTIHQWNGNFNGICFTPKGNAIICGDGTLVALKNAAATKLMPATSLFASSPSTNLIACADSLDNTLKLYNTRWRQIGEAPLPDPSNAYLRLRFSRDGSTLVGATWRAVTLWTVPGLQVAHRLAVHTTAIALSPNGSILALAVLNRLDIFATKTLNLIATRNLGFTTTTSLAFSPHGNRLNSAAGSRVTLWSLPGITRNAGIRLR